LETSQTLVYASSGSVYGNSGKGVPLEESQTSMESMNFYDMTKIVSDTVANHFMQMGKNIVGLRFGTVNGISPQTRTDLLLNSMMDSAMTSGSISVINGHINRAVLFLLDLEKAMLNVIEAPTSGIYNLASLNLTVMKAAEAVSDLVGAEIRTKTADANYDFALDVSKFVDTFGEFRVAEIEAELEKLREGLPIVTKSRRSSPGTHPLFGL
jgi:nucleoside-diphosphate-sugar epimerase